MDPSILYLALSFGSGLGGKIIFDWLKGNRNNCNSVDKKVDIALTKKTIEQVSTDIKGVGQGVNDLKIKAEHTNTLLGGILSEARETRHAIQNLKK